MLGGSSLSTSTKFPDSLSLSVLDIILEQDYARKKQY